MRALAADPERVDALKILAACHLRLTDAAGAESAARAAARLDPTDDRAAYLVAWSLWMRGSVDEARLWLREAIRMDPNDADYHVLQADIHAREQEWPRAEEAVDRGLRIDPESAWGLRVKVSVLLHTQRPRAAKEAAEGALRRHPEDAELHRLRGQAAERSGMRALARASFQEAVRLDPSDPLSSQALGALSAGDDLAARVLGGCVRARATLLPAILVVAAVAGFSASRAGTKTTPALPPSALLIGLAMIAGLLVAAPALARGWAARGGRIPPAGAARNTSRDEALSVGVAAVAWSLAVGLPPVAWLAGFSFLIAGQGARRAGREAPGRDRRIGWWLAISAGAVGLVILVLTWIVDAASMPLAPLASDALAIAYVATLVAWWRVARVTSSSD